jgi:hypothetical protein
MRGKGCRLIRTLEVVGRTMADGISLWMASASAELPQIGQSTMRGMIPDLKWLVDALKLPFKVIAAVALSAVALLVLELTGLLDLGPLAVFARTVLIVVSVVSIALVAVEGIAYLTAPYTEKQRQSTLAARRAIREQEATERRDAERGEILARLDTLSRNEVHIVAKALNGG